MGPRVLDCKIETQTFEGFSMGILPHTEKTIGGCLAVMDDAKPSDTGVLIYLNVDGRLDDAVSRVEELGGKVQKPKHAIGPHGFRAVILDSEGNRVALHSY